MNEKFIGWKEQLEMMEAVAAASGFSDYEDARASMALIFNDKYKKKNANDIITYEPIPKRKLQQFQDWLKNEE